MSEKLWDAYLVTATLPPVASGQWPLAAGSVSGLIASPSA